MDRMSAPERVYRAGDGALRGIQVDGGVFGLITGWGAPLTLEVLQSIYGPLRPQVVLDEDEVRALLKDAAENVDRGGGDIGDFQCAHCFRDYVLEGHEPDCFTLRARALLASIPSVEDDPK